MQNIFLIERTEQPYNW